MPDFGHELQFGVFITPTNRAPASIVALSVLADDASILPHLAAGDPALAPVIHRLTEEHEMIHAAIQDVDAALVAHLGAPSDHGPIQAAIDRLSDALLSHLAYEERVLVEPLARLGFFPGQVKTG